MTQIDSEPNYSKYADNIDLKKSLEILNMPGTREHALTVFNGKIYNWDARLPNKFNEKIMQDTYLIDIEQYRKAMQLQDQGKNKEALEIDFSSEWMKEIYKKAQVQEKLVNESSLPYYRTLGSAGANLIDTAYEVVRRVNYLTDVARPSYNMANFNAKNVVNVISTSDLNLKGFYKDALPTGQPEIGDNVTPGVAKLTYTAFEKGILADAFRYEFTMREKNDSVFSLEAQVQSDIPGVFAKMEDDKITTLINAISSGGDISPNWDAVTGNFYSADAAKDVETAEVALDNFGSGDVIILPRDTLRFYLRNIQAAINTQSPNSLQKPDQVRTGIMPRNPNLTYFVNNTITTGSFIVISKLSWADFYQGPKVNVSYKNSMTPGQLEGRILFSFNGVKEKIATASKRYINVAA